MPGSSILVEARGIRKRFRDVLALDGVDFSLREGEYLALLGPNGAGKTTLVEIIEGLRSPDEGEVRMRGRSRQEMGREWYRNLGISFQETRFLEKVTVLETLKLFASFYRVNDRKVEEVMERVGLVEKQKAYTKNLSGGQRQRLALGISLLNDPDILILDEPTTGLDPTARKEIWDILMGLKKSRGTSLILTTHYMEEAADHCDRIVIMDRGRFLAEGSLGELLAGMNMPDRVHFTLDRLAATPGWHTGSGLDIRYDTGSGRGELRLRNVHSDLPRFMKILQDQQLEMQEFNYHKPTLDDLFLQLTGRTLSQNDEP